MFLLTRTVDPGFRYHIQSNVTSVADYTDNLADAPSSVQLHPFPDRVSSDRERRTNASSTIRTPANVYGTP